MIDFTLLVLENSYASSVTISLDMLAAAARLAPRMKAPQPHWRVCSVRGGRVQLLNGISVQTERLPSSANQDCSVWIIPGLGLDTPAAIHERLAHADVRDAIHSIQAHAAAGGVCAASCSSVFVLNAAGLLRGKRATTSWWLAPELMRISPDCLVNADRMLCNEQSIITAGAAFAQTDLMLHLLRARCGPALATAVSRALLIDGRQAQTPYMAPQAMADGDDLIGRIATRIESSLPTPPKVGELAHEFCMSERTLARHVHRVTGKNTTALYQSIKQRHARALLETTRMTVDQVATAVGYQDGTALRRLMKRVTGASPSQFRMT